MRRSLPLLPLLILAACDDGGGAIVDAATIDTPMNDCGCVGDTPDPMVTVQVLDTAGPRAGVPVYFLDGLGAQVAMAATDASGQAHATMPSGGSVTAVMTDTSFGDHLATALGVLPGDTIYMRAPGGGTDMLIDLTVPANGTNGHYMVDTTCGSADVLTEVGTTATFQVQLVGCGATTDFKISADNGDGGPISTFIATNVAVSDAAAVTLTGTYAADVAVTQSYSNLPPTVSFVSGERAVIGTRGAMWATGFGLDVVGGAASGTLDVPVLGATGPALVAITTVNRNLGPSRSQVFAHPADGDYTLDATGALLPAFVAAAEFDIATHTLAWTEDPAGPTADLTFASLQVNRSLLKQSWTWDVVAPHAATAVVLPALPGAAADFNPVATDDVFVNDHLIATLPGGYAVGRQYAHLATSLEHFATVIDGRLVVERQLILAKRR
jgi:hypothetical protein